MSSGEQVRPSKLTIQFTTEYEVRFDYRDKDGNLEGPLTFGPTPETES